MKENSVADVEPSDNLTPVVAVERQRRPSVSSTGSSGSREAKIHLIYPMLDRHSGSLPFWKRIIFSLPFFGWFGVRYMKTSFMRLFYVDDYPRASLGYIALFSVVAVLIDAFSDPWMANATDTARPGYLGRRRPFVIAGGFATMIVFTLAYMPLVPAGTPASLWFGVFHICSKLCDTILLIPLEGWGAEMTPNNEERKSLWALRDFTLVFGILVGVGTPGLVQNLGGLSCFDDSEDGCLGLPLLGGCLGACCFMSTLLLAWIGTERQNEDLPSPAPKGTWSSEKIVPTLVMASCNRPFACLLLAKIAEAFGAYMPFTLMPFFLRAVVGSACMNSVTLFSIMAVGFTVFRMLGLPLWVMIGKRIGSFNAYLSHCILLALSHLVFLVIGKDDGSCVQSYISLASAALWGVVYGGSLFLYSIISDVTDYDEFVTGLRREAQYIMAISFMPKFFEVLAEAVPLILLAYFGYKRPAKDGPDLEQPAQVVLLLRMSFTVVPAVFILFGAFVMNRFPKAARTDFGHAAVYAGIEKHDDGEEFEDPWYPGNVLDPPRRKKDQTEAIVAYLFPSELAAAVRKSGTDVVDYDALLRRPVCLLASGIVLAVPGVVVTAIGWSDLSDDLGSSVSPLGMVLIGFSVLLFWFEGSRLQAVREMKKRCLTRQDVIAQYNFLCRFTGYTPIEAEPTQVENVVTGPECIGHELRDEGGVAAESPSEDD